MARKYEYQIIKLTGEPLNARLGSIREALGLIAAKYDGKPVAEYYAATERAVRDPASPINIPATPATIDRLVRQRFITLISA